MTRYGSPSLLVTVNSLNRYSKQLGHLPLCLAQSIPEMFKFSTIQTKFPAALDESSKKIVHTITTLW